MFPRNFDRVTGHPTYRFSQYSGPVLSSSILSLYSVYQHNDNRRACTSFHPALIISFSSREDVERFLVKIAKKLPTALDRERDVFVQKIKELLQSAEAAERRRASIAIGRGGTLKAKPTSGRRPSGVSYKNKYQIKPRPRK